MRHRLSFRSAPPLSPASGQTILGNGCSQGKTPHRTSWRAFGCRSISRLVHLRPRLKLMLGLSSHNKWARLFGTIRTRHSLHRAPRQLREPRGILKLQVGSATQGSSLRLVVGIGIPSVRYRTQQIGGMILDKASSISGPRGLDRRPLSARVGDRAFFATGLNFV